MESFEQCLKAKNIDEVYIATDSEDVQLSCELFTNNIIMTDVAHQSGTDRIAQAVKDIDCDAIINVQGDEPFIEPLLIEELATTLQDTDTIMASAMHRIEKTDDLKNNNVVKVTIDKNNDALYFSRSIIPHHRDEWET